jgi:hypothetical protein
MFQKKIKEPLMFAVVSENDAKTFPYPIVFVEKDGTVRELHAAEKKYLETPFYRSDGARPYVKRSYQQKDGFGSIMGYCYRSKIPSDITIHSAPIEDPTDLYSQELNEDTIKFAEEHGFEYVEEDGKMIYRRKMKG